MLMKLQQMQKSRWRDVRWERVSEGGGRESSHCLNHWFEIFKYEYKKHKIIERFLNKAIVTVWN